MKVAIDALLEPDRSGGVAQWVIGLAGALSNLPESEDRYLFVVNEGMGAWLSPYVGGSCRLTEVPRSTASKIGRYLPALRPVWRRAKTLSRSGSGAAQGLDWLFRPLGIDVVHFPHQSAYQTGLPYIYQPWDLQHLHLPEFFSDEDVAHRESEYRKHVTASSLVIVASRWTKRDLQAQYDVPSWKIAIVNVPPVSEFYPPATREAAVQVRDKYKLPDEFFFYPAQTYPHKNHLGLVEAVSRAASSGTQIFVVCSGNLTGHYEAIDRRIQDLGLQQHFLFTGFVEPSEIQALYSESIAMAFPSLFEGWGLPVFEAYAHGLPVVCSNATLLPDLVAEAAVVVDARDPNQLANALTLVAADKQLRDELSRLGRKRVAQFRWESTATLMRAHYRRVANKRLSEQDANALKAEPLV